MAAAAESVVWVLGVDPRVQRCYGDYRAAHGLGRHLGPRDVPELKAALFRDRDRDLAIMQRLVRDDLKLPYEWLAWLLLADFGLTVINEATGQNHRITLVPAADALPAGKAPRDRRIKKIARDVEWFYLAEIKDPRETPYSLGKEWAKQEGLSKESQDSTITSGIGNAKKLLAAFALEADPKSRDT
jgi:hypothetical protein